VITICRHCTPETTRWKRPVLNSSKAWLVAAAMTAYRGAYLKAHYPAERAGAVEETGR
jgi:hypothetical protein